MKRAIYPGSFDPITYGHIDIIERSTKMFDEVVVSVLHNKQKKPLFSIDERVNMIRGLTERFDNVRVMSFEGLLVDFAHEIDANIVIRGLRAVTDFEYELQIAQTNRIVHPSLDTVFLVTSLNYSYLSSTIVKEIASYGGDISKFVPAEIAPLIEQKYR